MPVLEETARKTSKSCMRLGVLTLMEIRNSFLLGCDTE
jgi:hypothetical protein